jgi:hypothetical protein
VLVSTLCIVSIGSVYVVINITDFEEGTKALIPIPLYSMNRRVSNRCNPVVMGISIALEAYENQDYNIDFNFFYVG